MDDRNIPWYRSDVGVVGRRVAIGGGVSILMASHGQQQDLPVWRRFTKTAKPGMK
jgi:hypothetical protein